MPLSAGELLNDQYQIESVLGRGGFGITYHAMDVKLQMPVAIKEYLPRDLAKRKEDGDVEALPEFHESFIKFKQRFLDEARILARLKHPNLVRVINFFESRNTAYFVMEFESGIPFSQYLRDMGGKIPEIEMMALLEPILDGLNELHERGIIHRDLKPDNLLIKSNGQPMLLDMGSARQLVEEGSGIFTSVLTPGYAPIEQYTGEAKNQGPWTDIYALACMVYASLTGTRPPDAMTRSAASYTTNDDPLVPFESYGFSPGLTQAVSTGLSMSFEQRPDSIAAWRAMVSPGSTPTANASDTTVVEVETDEVGPDPVKAPAQKPAPQPTRPPPLTAEKRPLTPPKLPARNQPSRIHFGRRLGAMVLDNLLLIIAYSAVFFTPILLQNYFFLEIPPVAGTTIIPAIIVIIYFFICLPGLKRNGQTLGKRWCRIRVTKATGDAASPVRIYLSRFWYKITEIPVALAATVDQEGTITIILGSIVTLILFTDGLMLFANKGRTLHDILAKTRVESAT